MKPQSVRISTNPLRILIRGGGDLASGVAMRLYKAGFRVYITELPEPMVVRRAVSFAEAVFRGELTVEGISARLAEDRGEASVLAERGIIPVLVEMSAGSGALPLIPNWRGSPL